MNVDWLMGVPVALLFTYIIARELYSRIHHHSNQH